MKKILLSSFLLASVAGLSAAQVLVHDGFETYKKDIPLSINGTDWGH